MAGVRTVTSAVGSTTTNDLWSTNFEYDGSLPNIPDLFADSGTAISSDGVSRAPSVARDGSAGWEGSATSRAPSAARAARSAVWDGSATGNVSSATPSAAQPGDVEMTDLSDRWLSGLPDLDDLGWGDVGVAGATGTDVGVGSTSARSVAPSAARSAAWDGSATGNVSSATPSAAQPGDVEMTELSAGDRWIRGLPPKEPLGVIEPSDPGSGWGGIDDAGSVAPSAITNPEIQPVAPEFWEMVEHPTPNSIRGSLEQLNTPEISIENLRNAGMSDPEITSMLESSYSGMDSFGVPKFNLSSIGSNLLGLGLNMLVINPLLSWIQSLGPVGDVVATGVNIYGAMSMLMDTNLFGIGIQAMLGVASVYAQQLHRVKENNYSGDTA
jgi:hypothetical protein